MKVKIENMISKNGNTVPNQFIIRTNEGVYFQSYSAVIVFSPRANDHVQLDEAYWNYSKTTAKYRNQFLGKKTKEIEKLIEDGTYILVDLN